MSRTARTAAAAAFLSALLCAGATATASAAAPANAAGPSSINWDTAPATGNSIHWD